MPTFTATCHTDDCGNKDQTIELSYDPEIGSPGAVMCGVCAQPITDVSGLPA